MPVGGGVFGGGAVLAEGLFFAIGEFIGTADEPVHAAEASEQVEGVDAAEDVVHGPAGVADDVDALGGEVLAAQELGGQEEDAEGECQPESHAVRGQARHAEIAAGPLEGAGAEEHEGG